MLRSFTTTTSSQVIREKVRGVQNFKILVGTTGRRPRAANPSPFAAQMYRHHRPRSPPRLPKQPEAGCHRQNRPSAAAWRGAVTRGDCRSRHFGTAVAVQAVKCSAALWVPCRAAPSAPLGTKSQHLMLHSCWCRWGKWFFVNEKIVNEFATDWLLEMFPG